jgi:hypothetical protein
MGKNDTPVVFKLSFRDAPDIRPFFISGIRSDTGFDLPDIWPDT